MKQNMIFIIHGELNASKKRLKELTDLFDDGWNVVSITPQSVSMANGSSSYTRYAHGDMLVLLERTKSESITI